ncbi:MAG: transglycosylase domain-containing protein [Candidatus Woesebacteria bacterium]|nr:transglycosylase domain-containing protein [Candidatus Woesebacteria bacterium]
MARKFFEKIKSFLKKEKNRKKIIFFTVLVSVSLWLFWGLPLPTKLSSDSIPVSTKLFDRNGKLIYEIYTKQRRTPINLKDLPQYVVDATISIEDKEFYKHSGFSPSGIVRSVFNIVFKRKLQGGSTITQQLVKNSLLTQERTVKRKIREFALTLVVETIYNKNQILEMYLNQIPYGSTAYGIESASELYFNKAARDLTLAEAALLAGLPQSPTKYSPFGAHPEYAKERQATVLKSMVDNKKTTKEDADKASKEELHFAQITPPKAPHFALWVKEQLTEKYGEKLVEQGGLRVNTTLDLDLQDLAQATVATEVGKLKKQKVGNGAAIVTRPKTGEILAMVGSYDYFAKDEDGNVNVTLANRQPGSSIKPINYALALRDKKINLATALADVPTCFKVAGQEDYCPVNYDRTFHGLVQARFALGNSYNMPAVRILALNGIDNLVYFANQMGLTTLIDPKNYGLSLTLGGGEVRPYDMAVAFGVFANSGIKEPLLAITKVTDWKGKVYEETKPTDIELTGERVLPPDVTFLISHALLDNNARMQAFGESSYLNVKNHPEVSVKTGTTNDRRDNWTIGFTPQALVVAWVGNNDNTPMGGAVSGVSGASPIWNKIMKAVLDKSEKGVYDKNEEGHSWPGQPDSIIGKTICAVDGLLPTGDPGNPGCPTRFEYFMQGSIPEKATGQRMDLTIINSTQQQASSDTPPDQVSTQNRPVYVDPLGTIYCMDCPIASTSAVIRYPLQ